MLPGDQRVGPYFGCHTRYIYLSLCMLNVSKKKYICELMQRRRYFFSNKLLCLFALAHKHVDLNFKSFRLIAPYVYHLLRRKVGNVYWLSYPIIHISICLTIFVVKALVIEQYKVVCMYHCVNFIYYVYIRNCMPEAGGPLNMKMPSYQYRDSHVKDKTVSPTVLSLT